MEAKSISEFVSDICLSDTDNIEFVLFFFVCLFCSFTEKVFNFRQEKRRYLLCSFVQPFSISVDCNYIINVWEKYEQSTLLVNFVHTLPTCFQQLLSCVKKKMNEGFFSFFLWCWCSSLLPFPFQPYTREILKEQYSEGVIAQEHNTSQ